MFGSLLLHLRRYRLLHSSLWEVWDGKAHSGKLTGELRLLDGTSSYADCLIFWDLDASVCFRSPPRKKHSMSSVGQPDSEKEVIKIKS